MATGTNGVILRSPDAVHWHQDASGTLQALRAVVAHRDALVAVGMGGTALRSSDGESWVTGDTGSFVTLRAAASDGEDIVAVGDGGICAALSRRSNLGE